MNSPDVDGESLQAVRNLRSRFEQLAVETSSQLRRPSTNANGSGPSSPRPRQVSASKLDISTPKTHLRTSSSSSDLKVFTKRPPPPPPPRIPKPPPSPPHSRSPSPPKSPQVKILNEDGEEGEERLVQGVAALKSKFDSPSRNGISTRAGASPLPVESPKPILPPRPAKNGETNLLSVSPSSTEPSSPVASRPVTPSQHHRPAPPPPPPISRSKSPRPSVEPDNGVAPNKSRL
ncbi:hypothetical protein AN958_07487 [Leucoagaricus sp. SymC.cos]|nr:hypothetical protein AN958_07487 [Leucoagaricus sp. SymC.cos]